MHKEQREFCEQVKDKFPDYFKNSRVIDFGSMDINGNNAYLFGNGCIYIGVDIGHGLNVNIVSPAHLYRPGYEPDVIICTEMLEHDQYWKQSLLHMAGILRYGGLLIITCATRGREEHGTVLRNPVDSPHTKYYYRNIGISEFRKVMQGFLQVWNYEINVLKTDLRFWGIKQ